MRRGKIVLIVLLAAIALCFTGILVWGITAGQGRFGADLRRSFSVGQSEHTQEIDLDEIRQISLDYGSADLMFRSGGGSQMILTEYFSGSPGEENYAQIQRDAQAGTVSVVKGKDYMSLGFLSFGSGLRRAEISIPEKYAGKIAVKTGSGNVDAKEVSGRDWDVAAGSGDIHLSNLQAETIAVGTGSGNVTMAGCSGRLKMTTGSGDVRVDNQDGSVRVETGSGDVELLGGSGKRTAETGSGDLLMDCGGADVQAKTGSGDVRIRKLEESSFSVKTETNSGDLGGSVIKALGADEDAEYFQGVYGAQPEFQVYVETSSGDIRLE